MEDIPITTADLLEAWRDATRAAELAARLARIAEEAADQAETEAMASTQIAQLAERAAEAASVAADRARSAADRATALAASRRDPGVDAALRSASEARLAESGAREQYHGAEAAARERQSSSMATEP